MIRPLALAFCISMAAVPAAFADDLPEAVRTTLSASYPLQTLAAGSTLAYGSPEWNATFDRTIDGVLQILPKDCKAERFRFTLCGLRINKVPATSMAPAIDAGELVFSLPYSSGADVRRGDIILFKVGEPAVQYLKRAVGLPGDTVELKSGVVHINGTPMLQAPGAEYTDGFKLFRETTPEGRSYTIVRREGPDAPPFVEDAGPFHVPDDALFVLGDNRHNSADSRFPEQFAQVGLPKLTSVIAEGVLLYISSKPERGGTVLRAPNDRVEP